jgi:hypothetical protein
VLMPKADLGNGLGSRNVLTSGMVIHPRMDPTFQPPHAGHSGMDRLTQCVIRRLCVVGRVSRSSLMRRSGMVYRPARASKPPIRAVPRRHTIALFVLMAVIPPTPAQSFNQDEFCVAVTDIARRMNDRKGEWLDRSTRYDGMVVDCAAKNLEVTRFLNTDPQSMRQGWKERKARAWNHAYCSDERWRSAIGAGWSIVSSVDFRSKDQLSFTAECEGEEMEQRDTREPPERMRPE